MMKTVSIKVLRHKKTKLLAAISEELRGLVVVGRTVEGLLEELPIALEPLLREKENSVVKITNIEIDESHSTGWAEYEASVVATYEMEAA